MSTITTKQSLNLIGYLFLINSLNNEESIGYFSEKFNTIIGNIYIIDNIKIPDDILSKYNDNLLKFNLKDNDKYKMIFYFNYKIYKNLNFNNLLKSYELIFGDLSNINNYDCTYGSIHALIREQLIKPYIIKNSRLIKLYSI
jgi:ribosome biogenesis protein Nip4